MKDNFVKNFLKEQVEKHEPLHTERIVPATAQEAFEGAFSHIAHAVCVIECHVDNCCYIISMEHAGYLDYYKNCPSNIIRAVNLTVRRFYQRHGLTVRVSEIHVFPSAYGFVIRIGLNTYGRKKIRELNREQYRNLKQR